MKLLAWLSSGDPQGLKGWRGSIIINTGYSTTHYGCNRASYEVFLLPLGGGGVKGLLLWVAVVLCSHAVIYLAGFFFVCKFAYRH